MNLFFEKCNILKFLHFSRSIVISARIKTTLNILRIKICYLFKPYIDSATNIKCAQRNDKKKIVNFDPNIEGLNDDTGNDNFFSPLT